MREPLRAVRRVRFGIGFNGGVATGYDGVACGLGTQAGIALNFSTHFSLRIFGNHTHTENGRYSTNLGLDVDVEEERSGERAHEAGGGQWLKAWRLASRGGEGVGSRRYQRVGRRGGACDEFAAKGVRHYVIGSSS